MSHYAEINAELTAIEQVDVDQDPEIMEARALTVTEMDIVGGGSCVAWTF